MQQKNPSPPRVGFLVIGRKRPGFDPQWGQQMEAAAWAALGRLQAEVARPAVAACDDGSLRQAVADLHRQGCDLLVVVQPTMGDGRLAPVLGQLWNAPVVFWATPERPDSAKVSSCSLVGAHLFGSLFRQLGRPFEMAYGHPEAPETTAQLARAIRLCAAGARLRRAKVGLIGSHAPGFINMHADPVLLSRDLGVEMHEFGLQEFFDLVEGQSPQAVEEDVDRALELKLPLGDGLTRADLAANSRYYLALRALLSQESLDALAVRCWPELPNRYGQWPYLAISRLTDEGRVVALEGDADGAISCLIGKLLGIGPGYISDWLDHDQHSITLWHPGQAPLALCDRGAARLGRHFNNNLPLVIDAPLAVGMPVTLFRLWRCDGALRATAWHARIERPRRELLGVAGPAVIDDRDVRQWFDTLCHAGMPHHVTLFRGHHADLLRAAARQHGLAWLDSP